MIADLIIIGDQLGYLSFMRAAMPAMWGEAMLVPATNGSNMQVEGLYAGVYTPKP